MNGSFFPPSDPWPYLSQNPELAAMGLAIFNHFGDCSSLSFRRRGSWEGVWSWKVGRWGD